MKLVFYSVVLNHHQAPVADSFYQLLGDDYAFVETTNIGDTKGGAEDYSQRPYLIQAWRGETYYNHAKELLRTAEVCVFGGTESFPYLKERMRFGLLSFQMGERWFKQGWKNLLSPRLQSFFWTYHIKGWKHKPLYKLCASAFTASDDYKLGMFLGRCYKWGYFPKVSVGNIERSKTCDEKEGIRMMWCARFIKWKHPELAILLACRLKLEGYSFKLDMYGDGIERKNMESLAKNLDVLDVLYFKGNVPNEEVVRAMQEHDIFLFTSDQNEGWGAVANESMSNGCVLVGADRIGSVPYLINDGVTGCVFQTNQFESLVKKVKWLLDNPAKLFSIQQAAINSMKTVWSPENAAKCLLILIENIQGNNDMINTKGPCSKA